MIVRSRRGIPIAARTKIEISPALCRRVAGLDDLARIVFPDNRNHRRAFVAMWLEIKYAERQFLSSQADISTKHKISRRTLEIVRAKLKRMGIVKRVSHFNPQYGYRSGWVFSSRFGSSLTTLAKAIKPAQRLPGSKIEEMKDWDSMHYV